MKGKIITILLLAFLSQSCDEVLNPEPIDLLVNDIVLNEPKDVEPVEIGLYNAFRVTRATAVIAGDLTADNLVHNGTFSQYRELGVKRITSSNASVAELWGNLYRTVYIANFMLERIPEVPGVSSAVRERALATAHLMRGLANFTAFVTYGGIPIVTTTDIDANRNIARATAEETMASIEADFTKAASRLPNSGVANTFASNMAVRAAFARFYLYQKKYAQAEAYATAIINSGNYTLEPEFSTTVLDDRSTESIFQVGYTIADDNDGNNLNTLFVGRREIIPSNEEAAVLRSTEAGTRRVTIKFDGADQTGIDNGFTVAKYGTAIENNNDILVFGLPEMLLIRAEARAYQGNVVGDNSAQTDINTLRSRAKAPVIGSVSQSQMIQTIENERRMELAFEGHRWYDLVRTGRANQVMPAFNPNWRDAYSLWPIPERELQNNPALVGFQNPGY